MNYNTSNWGLLELELGTFQGIINTVFSFDKPILVVPCVQCLSEKMLTNAASE